ncbi:Porin omp2b precursor [Pseudovibrio sp. Ad13]|uniref:porin n=1 Tax=Pseudovibrio sp. Ad13 TaxID=989396 RepID=UPI0007AE8FE4|nr:porin [Pseudovibrio sp. Ad13]KZK82308.1 Porin omp2b precursor [Pseudovibrio sp. Ad13]
MNFKKIAIAAAAAAAATPAMAADLPVVAEPVNYVQACDAFGAGYFQLPGQDTCIRVHGRIRTNYTSHDLTEGYNRAAKSDDPLTPGNEYEAENAYSAYAKGYIYLESMTDTEVASIKTYTELNTKWSDDNSSKVEVGSAYVQFGFEDTSVLIGRSASVFSAFGGYSAIGTIGPVSGGEDSLQISATTSFGNGFTASFGVMDAEASGLEYDLVDGNGNTVLEVNQKASKAVNFEGSLGVTQGMFSANLSAAAHAFNDFIDGDVTYGYAVAGTLEADVAENVKLGFGATYARNALSYAGGLQDGMQFVAESDDEALTAYTLVAGVEVGITDTLTGALDASYSSYDQDDYDATFTSINGSLNYAPVAGLNIILDAGWGKVDNDDSADADVAKVTTRVQYTF